MRTDNFGVVWGYVVGCAGCDVKMIVPNQLTDVCPRCLEIGDDDYPVGQVRG